MDHGGHFPYLIENLSWTRVMQDARCKMQPPLWNASSGRIGFVSWILYLFAEARLPALSGDKFHSALDWNVNGAFGFTDPPIAVEELELIGIELL